MCVRRQIDTAAAKSRTGAIWIEETVDPRINRITDNRQGRSAGGGDRSSTKRASLTHTLFSVLAAVIVINQGLPTLEGAAITAVDNPVATQDGATPTLEVHPSVLYLHFTGPWVYVVVLRVGDAWLVGVGKRAPHGFQCPCLVSPHGSLDRLKKSLYIISSSLDSKRQTTQALGTR